MMAKLKLLASALTAAGFLAACGGGGGDSGTPPTPAPKPQVKSIKVVGDSLSDSGTFGFKFTIQGNDSDGKAFKVWTERIAASYKLNDLCAHYQGSSEAMSSYKENASCSNYAVSGAQVNPVTANGEIITTPHSVLKQIEDLAKAGLSEDDLLLAAAGSNDAAALIENFMTAAQGNAMPLMMQLSSQLDSKTLNALVAEGQSGLAKAGGLYMQKVAAVLAAAVKDQLLAKGAKRIALLNIPAITLTPEFARVLAVIENTQGSQQAQTMATLFDDWVKAFNASLKDAFRDESRVVVADFYKDFQQQIATPATYGYTSVTVPACSLLGIEGDEIYKCSADLLSSNIPKGETAKDWWSKYMFSNAFHPTPYGHVKMSEIMLGALAEKGWN